MYNISFTKKTIPLGINLHSADVLNAISTVVPPVGRQFRPKVASVSVQNPYL